MSVVYRSRAAAAAIQDQYARVLADWPVPSSHITVPTREGPTFVVACGPPDAPPVILLHGAQSNAASYMFDAELWATKFRLYAIDMIGEAGRSADVRPDMASDSHAAWLEDVLAALGVGSAAMVGTSLGGWLALDFAVRRPARVAALALIGPAGLGRQKNFALKAAPLLLFGRWGRTRMLEMVFGPRRELPAAMQPLAELARLIGKGIRPRFGTLPLLSDAELRGIRVPLLAILGGRDALIDMHEAKTRLEREVPAAEICFLAEGYHYLPEQAPRIMDFLEQLLVARGQQASASE